MGNNCMAPTQPLEIGGHTIKIRKTLARGGYGFVYLVKELSSKKQNYALKIITLKNPDCVKVFQNENHIIKIIGDHPNIIKIYASQKKQQVGMILMQLAKMTLWQLLAKTTHNPLTQYQIIYILKQITLGLHHIHSKGYAHRDIKTQNILIMEDGTIRICDFGSCTNQFMNTDDIKTSKVSYIEKEIGKNTTWMFRPPELIDLRLGYRIDQNMDMWMLGIISYIMVFYKSPWKNVESQKEFVKEVIGKEIVLPKKEGVSEELKVWIGKLLKPNPEDRFTSEQALEYLNGNFKITVLKKEGKDGKDGKDEKNEKNEK